MEYGTEERRSEKRITDINGDIFQTHADLKNCERIFGAWGRTMLSTWSVTVCDTRGRAICGKSSKARPRTREAPVNGWWWEGERGPRQELQGQLWVLLKLLCWELNTRVN